MNIINSTSAQKTSGQIVERFGKLTVRMHGLQYSLEELCSGVLVTGATGCGKTMEIVNQLASVIAVPDKSDRDTKPAIIYINAKGNGARDFEDRLPRSRHGDILRIDSSSQLNFHFFDRTYWNSPDELSEAVVSFINEAARHNSGTPDTEGNHKVYFDNLRDRCLRQLSKVGHLPEAGRYESVHPLVEHFCPRCHLAALIRRIKGFTDAVYSRGRTRPIPTSHLALAFGEAVTGILNSHRTDEYAMVERMKERARQEGRLATDDAAWAFAQKLISWAKSDNITDAIQSERLEDPFMRWCGMLPSQDREEIDDLFRYYDSLHETSQKCLIAELENLWGLFDAPLIRGLLFPSNHASSPVSFESIIDHGRILIIDLPPADMAGSARFALTALSLQIMATTLRRYRTTSSRGLINQERPIVMVADEFQSYLCSLGRHDGLELWLSRSREFGVIPILATQNLNLLYSAARGRVRAGSILANLRTRFFGQNSCPDTNAWAAFSCSNGSQAVKPPIINWYSDPAVEYALAQIPMIQLPVLTDYALSQLEIGEFIVQKSNGSIVRINANRRLSAVRVEPLSSAPGQAHEGMTSI